MAEVSLTDLFTAIDEYMSENGVSSAGNYLASKVTALFDDDKAPLNAETGPLKNLSDKVEEMVDKMTLVNREFDAIMFNLKVMGKKLTQFFGTLGKTNLQFTAMRNAAEKITTALGKFNLKSPTLPKSWGASKAFDPKRILATLHKVIRLGTEKGVKKSALSKQMQIVKIDPKEILKVQIVGIDKKLNLGGNTYVSSNSKGKQETGLFGKIFNFLLGTAAAITGIYFIQKFLDETELGKRVKGYVKGYIKKIGDWLGKKLESGEIAKGADKIISFIGRAFSYVFNGVSDFIEKHHEKIAEIGSTIFTSFKKHIVDPILGKIKDGFTKHGASGALTSLFSLGIAYFVARLIPIVNIPIKIFEFALKKVGTLARLVRFTFSKIIKALSFVKDIALGIGRGLKNLGGWIFRVGRAAFGGLFRFIGTIGRAIMPLLEGGLGAIVSGLRFLFATPLGLAITAAVTSLTILGKKLYEFSEGLDDFKKSTDSIVESQERMLKQINKTVDKKDSKVEELKKAYEFDPSEINRLKLKQAEIEQQEFLIMKKKEEAQNSLNKSYQSQWGISQWLNNDEYLWKQRHNDLWAEKERRKIQKDEGYEEIKKRIKEIESSKKIKENIMVEPQTKDRLSMTKKNNEGISDIKKKFDDVMSLLAGGFAGTIQATHQSGGVVASAVANTAKSQASGGVNSSGFDSIKTHRERTRSFVGG